MSQTWGNFVGNVQAALNTGAQDIDIESSAIRAVADYVKSRVAREVNADIPLAKSYENLYREAKVRLGGYVIESAIEDVQAQVKTLLTIDGARDGISGTNEFVELETIVGVNDFNGVATQVLGNIVDAVVEIQRKAPRFRSGFETTYLKGGSGVAISGFVTQITLATKRDIVAVRYGDYHAPLAGSTAYALDAKVTSNGRVYKCVTAGTTAGSIGAGLVETDGTVETIGTASFEYYGPTNYRAARQVSWQARYALLQGTCDAVEPTFCINPDGTELWVHPALDADHAVKVEWRALTMSFSDGDTVPFDQTCETACAEYARAMLQKNLSEDIRQSGASFALWQQKLKRLWLDL